MRVTFWGTRGSLATPGPETARLGGNTACVEVRGDDGAQVVLDAGTGIRRCGAQLPREPRRVDVLLTHLHMDHIQGLGFFAPLYDPSREVHIWGPASTTQDLRARLMRYLSPPLFPVTLRELPCRLVLHEVPRPPAEVGELLISSALVCHPGPTVGYRVDGPRGSLTYLPDHEPALGARRFPLAADWTSGHQLARDVDLLVHDTQYTDDEYPRVIGWGHSTLRHALAFAEQARARRLVAFHHDPQHDDDMLDRHLAGTLAEVRPGFPVSLAAEGDSMPVA